MTDYKKLYEEALERAKEMSALPDDRATIEYIFPELKESEDEKIRKTLIKIFKKADMGGKIFGESITYTQVVAWLEKQGEKLPVGFYYVDSNGNKYFSDTFKNGNFTFHVEKDEQILSNSSNIGNKNKHKIKNV